MMHPDYAALRHVAIPKCGVSRKAEKMAGMSVTGKLCPPGQTAGLEPIIALRRNLECTMSSCILLFALLYSYLNKRLK